MPRRRSVETIERDHRAYDMFRRGMSYRQIGAELGINEKTAWEAVRRAARENASDPLEQAAERQVALDRLQDYRRAAQRVLMGRHYQASQSGKLVLGPDGSTPLPDPDPPLRALAQLRWIEQEDNRLRDLYPAVKSRVEVITEDIIDAELAMVARQIAENDARAAAAGTA